MSACKKCGAEVVWKQKPGGGFMPPENPDGTRHKCDGAGVAKPAQKAAAPKEAKITNLSAPPKTAAETQDIQAEYVRKEQTHVFLKDCVGEEKDFRADLEVIKMLSKAESPVQPGKKYRFRLIKQRVVRDNGYADEWVISRVGTFEESFGEKPFKTGKEILQENIDQKKAETEKADAALAQIQKEEAEAAARAQENQEYLKTLTEGQKPMSTSEPTTTPEKSPQNESVAQTGPVTTKDAGIITPDDLLPATGGVEIGIHVNLGNYSSFDLKVTGINGDHARQLLAQESAPTIALVKGIIKDASKGY